MRPYNPHSKKLDQKTISGYFIGYCVGLSGLKFYCLLHATKVIESDRAIHFEVDIGTSLGLREIVFKEHSVFIPVSIASAPISGPIVYYHPIATIDDEPIEDVDLVALDVVMDIPLRRSERSRRPTISDDYIIYFQEHEYDAGDVLDSTTYKEAIASPQSNF